jgi:hypothetical protein
MTRHKAFACLFTFWLGIFLFAFHPCAPAAENSLTLKGRVDPAGLDVPAGPFVVRALRAQNRSIELGKANTDGGGNFQLTVAAEAVAVYGVVLEARSVSAPTVVLEAAVLRAREAGAPIAIDSSSTIETAMLNWRVQARGKDLEALRPLVLFGWLRPITDAKTRDGLKRAGTLLAKWAVAAAPASQSSAAVLAAALGDVRQMDKRLAALGVAPAAIAQLQATAKKDAEVAYVLTMPYFLEL